MTYTERQVSKRSQCPSAAPLGAPPVVTPTVYPPTVAAVGGGQEAGVLTTVTACKSGAMPRGPRARQGPWRARNSGRRRRRGRDGTVLSTVLGAHANTHYRRRRAICA